MVDRDIERTLINNSLFSALATNTYTSPSLRSNERTDIKPRKYAVRSGPVPFSEDLNVFSVCYFIDRLAVSLKAPRRIEMVAFELLHVLCTFKEISFRDIPAVATACFFLSNKVCVDDCMTLRFKHVLKGAHEGESF